MNLNWTLIGIAAANLTLSTAGDICAKLWGMPGGQKWLYIGMAINVFTIFSFMAVVRWGGLAVSSTVVLILTIVLNTLVGAFIFRESVAPTQWAGIALGVIAIVLVSGLVRFGQ